MPPPISVDEDTVGENSKQNKSQTCTSSAKSLPINVSLCNLNAGWTKQSSPVLSFKKKGTLVNMVKNVIYIQLTCFLPRWKDAFTQNWWCQIVLIRHIIPEHITKQLKFKTECDISHQLLGQSLNLEIKWQVSDSYFKAYIMKQYNTH